MSAVPTPCRPLADGVELTIRVTPRGGRDSLDGIGVDASGRSYWQLRVRVAPEDGAANRAVLGVLAERLGLPLRNFTLVAGETARVKRIRIAGNPETLLAQVVAISAGMGDDRAR